MSNDFFEVRPIEWVDLPFSLFDRWGERMVSEAALSSPFLSIPIKVYETKMDDRTCFTVSISSTSVRGSFDTIEDAKMYVTQALHASISALIRPAYTAPEAKALEVKSVDND